MTSTSLDAPGAVPGDPSSARDNGAPAAREGARVPAPETADGPHDTSGADGTDLAVGRVRWFSQEKGYGFIQPEAGEQDVFVRHSVLDGDGFRCLEADQRVRFAWTADPRGPRATAVHVID